MLLRVPRQTPYKCSGLASSYDEPGRVCSTTFQSLLCSVLTLPNCLLAACCLAGCLPRLCFFQKCLGHQQCFFGSCPMLQYLQPLAHLGGFVVIHFPFLTSPGSSGAGWCFGCCQYKCVSVRCPKVLLGIIYIKSIFFLVLNQRTNLFLLSFCFKGLYLYNLISKVQMQYLMFRSSQWCFLRAIPATHVKCSPFSPSSCLLPCIPKGIQTPCEVQPCLVQFFFTFFQLHMSLISLKSVIFKVILLYTVLTEVLSWNCPQS